MSILGRTALTVLFLAMVTPTFAAGMTVKLLAPWDGKKVPAGQQCVLDGGKGSTPPMQVSDLPEGTVSVVVAFNDKSYPPLSSNGGHGTIGFAVKGTSAKLTAVPGMTKSLGHGAVVVKKARSTGNYASPGYLPPCSGGRGNRYSADVTARDAAGKVLAKVSIDIGRY